MKLFLCSCLGRRKKNEGEGGRGGGREGREEGPRPWKIWEERRGEVGRRIFFVCARTHKKVHRPVKEYKKKLGERRAQPTTHTLGKLPTELRCANFCR